MRPRVFLLIHLLVVFGLIVPAGLEAAPRPSRAASPWLAATATGSTGTDDPAFASKRARVKKDRRQDRRKAAARKQRHDRQRSRSAKNRAGRERQRTSPGARAAQSGHPVEIPSGRLPAAETVSFNPSAPASAEDRYIVVLEDDAGDPRQFVNTLAANATGITPTHVYEHVFNGFAAVIPDDELTAVKNDARVKAVVPDAVVTIGAQPVPPGIARIDADDHPIAKIDGIDERVNVDVAVIDTAGDDFHPDLNIHAWANCTDSPNNRDDHGHGTHVGGTIGALDNEIGVVGVAPGARLWNFRVLKAVPGGGATGLNSWIICGLDLVTFYAIPRQDGLGDIEVANASLGGSGQDSSCQAGNDPYHAAFCRAVAAGVTVVVAAMNNAQDASNFVPATFSEVITVSALADSDGRPGGLGPNTSAGADDTLATFSNFGEDINIAAPGVDILSTVPSGTCDLCSPTGYRLSNGTSMASPHVSGAAALYLVANPGASPQQVKTALINAREIYRFPNDRDNFAEGVLRVIPPPVTGPSPDNSGSVSNGKKKKKQKKQGKKHGKKHGKKNGKKPGKRHRRGR